MAKARKNKAKDKSIEELEELPKVERIVRKESKFQREEKKHLNNGDSLNKESQEFLKSVGLL